ncbi:Rhodanese-like domain-containing protein [Globomyces pollinis-pini]|nr:Rhodanese-like domain-containing protein [Globomyces pollinis-pini]KAJ2994382.1 hypothetical protein HDV02_001656 [Globomyces sp. JEL0801]
MFSKTLFRQASRASFSSSALARGLFKDYVAKLNVKYVTASQLDAIINENPLTGLAPNVHLIDVRETYEWNEDHIPFSTYLGKGVLERDIQNFVPDVYDQVILYCAGGDRASISADNLSKMGYKQVAVLKGGMGAWKQAGRPIVTNERAYSDRVLYGKTVEEEVEYRLKLQNSSA